MDEVGAWLSLAFYGYVGERQTELSPRFPVVLAASHPGEAKTTWSYVPRRETEQHLFEMSGVVKNMPQVSLCLGDCSGTSKVKVNNAKSLKKKKKGSEPFDGKQSTGKKSTGMYFKFKNQKKIQSRSQTVQERDS